ncbi:ArsR/SmtB family transcription factor [Rubinisphaera sp. JC750]|uniref:ArsR/SmtB family transcription factor n=1 Tax=Rubinisphaera sp. JC750 TaxID=2898658 RepID=UPI001F0289BE|nr:metalloregulator ArsR/SmtB family transcription factor [Rubinisphaera sp. JC750]
MGSRTQQLDTETIFRALSDRTRLRILNLLRGGELCVCDLVDVLDVPQPTASRHLAYLRNAGLVLVRKEGLWHYYRLVVAPTPFLKQVFACVNAAAAEDEQLTVDTERLRVGRQSDCCG